MTALTSGSGLRPPGAPSEFARVAFSKWPGGDVHRSDCFHVGRIKPENVRFARLRSLADLGVTKRPCRDCVPFAVDGVQLGPKRPRFRSGVYLAQSWRTERYAFAAGVGQITGVTITLTGTEGTRTLDADELIACAPITDFTSTSREEVNPR